MKRENFGVVSHLSLDHWSQSFGTRTGLMKESVFHRPGWGEWFWGDSSELHVYWSFVPIFHYIVKYDSNYLTGCNARSVGPGFHTSFRWSHLGWWESDGEQLWIAMACFLLACATCHYMISSSSPPGARRLFTSAEGYVR